MTQLVRASTRSCRYIIPRLLFENFARVDANVNRTMINIETIYGGYVPKFIASAENISIM